MPDHVHLIAGMPQIMSVSEALRLLKGGSAYELFRAKPNFRKRYQKLLEPRQVLQEHR
jgi:REP element-mobilizing transposase RayT